VYLDKKKNPQNIVRIYHFFNPLNGELNPICHLLALLAAHHILYVSRIRVNARFLRHLPGKGALPKFYNWPSLLYRFKWSDIIKTEVGENAKGS
jgi:hypothetical protein